MLHQIINTLTPQGKRSLIFSIVGFVVYAVTGLAMMLLVLLIIASVIRGESAVQAYWPALGGCLLLKGVSNILADKYKHYAGFDIVYQIREQIIVRLKSFSLGFYTHERLGEISTIIHKDVDNMEMVVGHMWTRMSADFLVTGLLLIGAFALDYRMALLMISLIPAALILLALSLKKAQKLELENGNLLANLVSLFVEYVKGISLLKAFSESKKIDSQLEETAVDFGQSSETIARNKAKILAVYGLLIDGSFWIMLFGGMLMLAANHLSPLVFLIFAVAGREFYKPFRAMDMHWMNYLKVTDSFRRIKHIIDAPTVQEPSSPRKAGQFWVDFEDVSFAYEADGFLMDHVSFHAPANTLTALVGESGSGKTTVTNLLLRFWDVTGGSVSIGNVDIRQMAYDDLLANVSIVMQNVQLFADTIEANIRIGKADATEAEIIQAARRARIDDFIMTLPQGYQTLIGENGVGLSGGQRQRISIARAFLKDAPILILDEVTSNVDPVNEALIQDAISELARERTVFVIAHHLRTIRSADQILVFAQGRLAERGTHAELLAADGPYAKLWQMQKGTVR